MLSYIIIVGCHIRFNVHDIIGYQYNISYWLALWCFRGSLLYDVCIDFCSKRHKTRTLSHGTPWNSILMAQLDMCICIFSICYQYMPLTQHELLQCEALCYIITYTMMHYAVQCIVLHHIMVLYRSSQPMMPNPFISYHKIVILDTYSYSVIDHSLCAIWHPRGYRIYHHT